MTSPDKSLSTAHARATVTLEFPVEGGGWGEDCQLAQVYRQAERTAREQITRAMQGAMPRARIIGEIKITAVLVEKPAD